MKRLDSVSCSLNLGYIYNINYSYSPENGISMTIFFVNERGEYQKPNLLPMQKSSIRIGPASFSLYAKSFKISKASGRKVISVDFVDETFMLDNYQVVLTGRGCGTNIYQLGTPVDKRTIEQKIKDSLDPVAQKIKEFTQFPDLEYSFDDFLTVLRQNFSVQVNAAYNTSITRSVTGTFRSVLSDWCNFFNLAFYFENSQIKIYDPTRLSINIPQQSDIREAISYEYSEDISSTYGKTVSRYFEQEGGEKPYNDTEGQGTDKTGQSNTIKALTLYPIGFEFGLSQTTLDPKQVAAAMYGKEFWLLYNISNNSLDQCGWTKVNITIAGYPTQNVAYVDDTTFNEKFEAYYKYGKSIAGRWYLSNKLSSLDILKDCVWISEAEGAVFDVLSNLAEERRISLKPLEPATIETSVIEGTEINNSFLGINFTGNRLAFYDQRDYGSEDAFLMTDTLRDLISKKYEELVPDGSKSVQFGSIDGIDKTKQCVLYSSYSASQDSSELGALITSIKNGDKTPYLTAHYKSYPIKGVRRVDLINMKDITNQPDELAPVGGTNGNVVTNTGLIAVKKNGAYTVYYDKYSKCVSRSSIGSYFGHNFDIERISDDNVINFQFNKTANTYSLNRDYAAIESLLNNPYLQSLAEPRNFVTKTASFSLNYYYTIPQNFLSNGLVGLQMEISDGGVSCSYTFSNSILKVPDKMNEFQQFENSIKNSLLRKYNPQEVIT